MIFVQVGANGGGKSRLLTSISGINKVAESRNTQAYNKVNLRDVKEYQ